MKQYLWNIAVSIDQLANTIIGGTPDTTISGRLYYHREHPAAWVVMKFVDFLFSPFEKNHCEKSYERDEVY